MILCLTSIHNRPAISEIFLQGMARLDIPVFAVTTSDTELCQKYNARSFKWNNNPLGARWNELGRKALELDWTHVLIMGDDNVLHPDALDHINQNLHRDYFGFNSINFIHPETQRAKQFTISQVSKVIGAGRVISRKAFTAASKRVSAVIEDNLVLHRQGRTEARGDRIELTLPLYQYLSDTGVVSDGMPVFRLWRNNINNRLDYSADYNMASSGYLPYQIRTNRPMLVDIKTEQNIWSYDTLPAGTEANYNEVVDRFGLGYMGLTPSSSS